MARKKRSIRYVYRKAKRKVSRRSKGFGQEMSIVVTAFAEPYLDNLINQFAPNLNVSDDILKLGLGWYAKKRGGIIGSVGRTLYTIQLYKLAQNITAGGLGSIFGTLQQAKPSTPSWTG